MSTASRNVVLSFLLGWGVLIPVALAAENLEQIFAGFKTTRVSEMAYTEVRYMQLLAAPRKATGKMYISPGKILIAQTLPKQTIILLSGGTLLYVEPAEGVRYSKSMNGLFALPGIGEYLRILQGEASLEQVRAQYRLDLVPQNDGWMVRLTPRKPGDISQVNISGRATQGVSGLELIYADGDRTVWQMSPLLSGGPAQKKMDALVELARSFSRASPSLQR